jgi:pSer/pThr/pTyr-binding forkhead associated (FHA) protein
MTPFMVSVTLPGTQEHFTKDCGGTVVIGRNSECDIPLNNPLVSRRHVEILPQDDGRFSIRDLGSLNGTRVDDQTIRNEAIVIEGTAQIQIGPYIVVISRALGSDSDTVMVPTHQRPARVTLDRGKHAALVDGRVVIESLAPLEYKVLDVLSSAAPDLVESKKLGDVVWEPGQWDAYMMHNLIRRLRRKLEVGVEDASELIVTVQGAGYRLG